MYIDLDVKSKMSELIDVIFYLIEDDDQMIE